MGGIGIRVALFPLLLLLFPDWAVGQSPDAADLQAAVDRRLAETHDELIEVRRDIHRHPEVSGREERTARGRTIGPVLDRGQQKTGDDRHRETENHPVAVPRNALETWLPGHRLLVGVGPPGDQEHATHSTQQKERSESLLKKDVLEHRQMVTQPGNETAHSSGVGMADRCELVESGVWVGFTSSSSTSWQGSPPCGGIS